MDIMKVVISPVMKAICCSLIQEMVVTGGALEQDQIIVLGFLTPVIHLFRTICYKGIFNPHSDFEMS